jgi:hypothetical protein
MVPSLSSAIASVDARQALVEQASGIAYRQTVPGAKQAIPLSYQAR